MLLTDLAPKPKEPALKYGCHELRRGAEHVYCKREALGGVTFKGNYIDDVIPWSWRAVLKFTRSRLYPWFDAVWKLHRRYLRRRLGISTISVAYSESTRNPHQ